MKSKKIIIIVCSIILLVAIGIIVCSKVNNNIDNEKKLLVENYIAENYCLYCKVNKSSFTYNEYGITGGLYMYSFECEDGEGKNFTATYSLNKDLCKDTISHLKVDY